MSPMMTILAAVLTGGLATKLLDIMMQSVTEMRRQRAGRETELQEARRLAARWETVAIRARVVALYHGASLSELPLGPGEDAFPAMGDDDAE